MSENKREGARPLEEMDNASREEVTRILSKEPAAVSDGERRTLWGRRDYLTKEQQKDFGVDKEPAKPTVEGGDEGDDYDEMNGKELNAELKARGLPQKGTNVQKREALREDDEAQE